MLLAHWFHPLPLPDKDPPKLQRAAASAMVKAKAWDSSMPWDRQKLATERERPTSNAMGPPSGRFGGEVPDHVLDTGHVVAVGAGKREEGPPLLGGLGTHTNEALSTFTSDGDPLPKPPLTSEEIL